MSKSKGNVVDPMEVVEQYGADAIRFALVYGTALGNDQALSYPKLQAMRNFTNKLWNIGRFIEMQSKQEGQTQVSIVNQKPKDVKNIKDQEILSKIKELSLGITELLNKYDFNHAAQNLYEFIWHTFADIYIEDVKNRIDENSYTVLTSSYLTLLKLLHPFMPFITEEIYTRLYDGKGDLIINEWPKA